MSDLITVIAEIPNNTELTYLIMAYVMLGVIYAIKKIIWS